MCNTKCRCQDHVLWFGMIAFLFGVIILLQRFDILPTATWDYFWPSAVLVTGLKMMLSSFCSCQKDDSCCSDKEEDCCCADLTCQPSAKDSKKKPSKKK